MKFMLPILFATIAAVGNALFAFGQKHSNGAQNGLLFVGASLFVAFVLTLIISPMFGPFNFTGLLRARGTYVAVSGAGLFLTSLGFNLLYARFGASHYVLYAAISIITTTVIVGYVLLREPLNGYHVAAIAAALATVVLFSVGQSRP